ncbi:hypothetical protein [Xanthomonas maliensis]|uniref:hypothetical protein n=1 Tax=Xanthomonas maliensis TaxID=1321368 RepID=UPI00039BE93C|nr:hypothetical protein [Xanthomonas maliensis]KAB7772236.1 hypothetical protein CKY51_01205 [Xanthomonas maliensis]
MPAACRLLLLTALSLAAVPALAQHNAHADLQSQMSPEQFKAAGLNKLDARELAALNDWLQGKVATQSAAAVEQAKEAGRQEVIVKNRGFFDFGSKEPIQSTLVGEFAGFAKSRVYVLANGQEWEQTDSSSLPGVRKSSPKVQIKPGLVGVWYLQIDGYNTQAKVRRIK